MCSHSNAAADFAQNMQTRLHLFRYIQYTERLLGAHTCLQSEPCRAESYAHQGMGAWQPVLNYSLVLLARIALHSQQHATADKTCAHWHQLAQQHKFALDT